ncbi:MAG: uncharacterized protein JWQ99_3940 [Blastococcus sp.]|nr:uncharacterized protein [Blastococcus sp.]
MKGEGPRPPHPSQAQGGALDGALPARWPTRRPPFRALIWAACTVALVVVGALLWRGSDAAATESTTAASAGVLEGTPADAVSQAWAAEGDPLPGDVVEGGRVILASAHGVQAVDPESGEEAWHYTRSNARLCGVTAVNGVVVTVFRTADRCDEAVALFADTGIRAWTRNVGFRGDARLSSTDRIVLAASATGLVTLDPTGNGIRWRYTPPEGCLIDAAEVGSAGVALVQTCDETSVLLKLLDGFDGKMHWERDLPADQEVQLLGADQLLGVVVGNEVQGRSAADGAVRATLPLPSDADQPPRMRSVEGVSLVLIHGTLHALDPQSGKTRWKAPARGLPAAGSDGSGSLLVPEDGGFAHLDPASGDRLGASTVSDVPAGGTAAGVGPMIVYRLPDRVVAYR